MTTASRCPAFSPVRSSGRPGLLVADQLRHRPFRGGEDLLFGVQVGQGAVPFLVRRPVDAAAVGGPHPQAGHVGEVRRGDLDDLGPGPAGDGQLGHLGDHRLGVGARRQHGQRPVHLEPELSHRPDRVVLLHLGDGDPRGFALGRIVQHRRCTPGVLGGEPGDLLVHRRQGLHFPLCRLCFPGGQPLRLRWARRCRPARRRCGVPRPWCAGCSAPPAGRAARSSAWTAACRAIFWYWPIRAFSSGVSARDRELNRSITSWLTPPTSAPLPSARGHHGVAQRGQPGLHDPVGHRGDREPLVVQAAGVQRAPFVIGAVGALHPVPHGYVHVQVRVAVAADVVQEHAGDQAVTVPPLPRPGRMVPGAGVGGVPFQPGDRVARRVHQRGLDLIGPRVERGGLVLVAALARLAGRDPVGGVQHRHALDHVDGQVEVRHQVRVLAALGRADLGQLGRAGVRMRGPVRRHRGLFPLVGRPGLAALDQEFPAGPDVVLVQPADHGRVDLAGQPERRGAFAGPLAGRLPGRGVVGHRAGAASGVLARGQVGHVVAWMQRRERGHGRSPRRRLPLASVADACLGSLSSTHGR